MSIDEAIAQLTHIPQRKGAYIVKEILEEAREIAVEEHNFEFRSKMWVAESFCTKGFVQKGLRKHARMRFGEITYFHTHYYVKLVEGDPPKKYLPAQAPYPELDTVEEKLNQYVDKMRKRRIDYGL
jgi:large subunit ribosomal protein L22